MALELKQIPGDKVRIPDLQRGVAAVISRYDKERAVVVHPDDFHRLEALDAFISGITSIEPIEFTEAAVAAHQDAETPSEPVVDPVRLAELFGG